MKLKRIMLITLSLLMISAVIIGTASAATTFPDLPAVPVQMTVTAGTSTYLNISLASVPTGFDVTNGYYPGWCAGKSHNIDADVPYTVYLVNSMNATLPSYFANTNWNKINYILNNKVGSDALQIQQAIWFFTDNYAVPSTSTNALTMISNANANPTFVPGNSQIIAVICASADFVPIDVNTAFSLQPTILELQVPQITPHTPTITTTLYLKTCTCNPTATSSITIGQSVIDKAYVTDSATGQVRFEVSTDGGVTFTQYGAIKTLSGGSATSDSYTPKTTGTFYFRAVYLGDTTHAGSQSGNLDEPLTVQKLSTTTTTCLSIKSTTSGCTSNYWGCKDYSWGCSDSYWRCSESNWGCEALLITLGQSVTDKAHVSNSATGQVRFEVSTDGGVTFTQYGAIKTLSGGSATSDSYTPKTTGTFYFRAVYLGDTTHAGSQSGNKDESLTVKTTSSTHCSYENWCQNNYQNWCHDHYQNSCYDRDYNSGFDWGCYYQGSYYSCR
jgi:hypothetical protein